jgi:hypothetical protein
LEGEFVVQIRVNFDPLSLPDLEDWLKQLAIDFAGDQRFRLSFHAIGRWGGPNDPTLSVCGAEAAAEARMRLTEIAARNGFSNDGISLAARCILLRRQSILDRRRFRRDRLQMHCCVRRLTKLSRPDNDGRPS